MSDNENSFSEYKIISSESKSWFVGKPGTNRNSFSVTWSPGAMVLYGEKGNVTLIYSQFNSYEKAKQWLAKCDLEEFKGTIAHSHPENIEYFYKAFRHWGEAQHFK